VRGHGPGGRYSGSYSDAELELWASRIGAWRDAGLDVFAYFDNDIGCAAPGDAERLKASLGVAPPRAPAPGAGRAGTSALHPA
jgi:uncharacterized protein YecE (DUF72 family)